MEKHADEIMWFLGSAPPSDLIAVDKVSEISILGII
jgi:hypothetical protein